MCKIQLYGFWRSLASFRVRAALRLKQLEFDEIPIDVLTGEQFDAGYSSLNPERVVPTLMHHGNPIFQSLAIIEYLDEVWPKPRLMPATPAERAFARALALVTVADAHPLVTPRVRNYLAREFGAKPQDVETWAGHWTAEGLTACEGLLAQRNPTPFVFGADPGVADICVAGQVVGAQFLKLNIAQFPTVARLADQCFALPAFAISHPYSQDGYKRTLGG